MTHLGTPPFSIVSNVGRFVKGGDARAFCCKIFIKRLAFYT